uniref:Uncharacterized protein n=1 Tax=Romanomermis culicivorax TaxID=13658 RepID=A0A915IDG1_ROMCU
LVHSYYIGQIFIKIFVPFGELQSSEEDILTHSQASDSQHRIDKNVSFQFFIDDMPSSTRKKFQSSKKRSFRKHEERLHLLEKTEERTDDNEGEEEENFVGSSRSSTDLEQDNHGYGALLSKNYLARKINVDQHDKEKVTKSSEKKRSLRHLFSLLSDCLLAFGVWSSFLHNA